MTVLIGITQTPEETERHLCMEFKGIGTRAIVGPFGSSEQASDWVEFMKARDDDYTEVPVPSADPADHHWYGFTFEWLGSKPH